MADGIYEKLIAPLAGFGIWIYSVERRLANRVTPREINGLKDQANRLESHLWDLMKAQQIIPSVEPPEEVKRLNNREK